MTNNVIGFHGGKFCYVNADEPTGTLQPGWLEGLAPGASSGAMKPGAFRAIL